MKLLLRQSEKNIPEIQREAFFDEEVKGKFASRADCSVVVGWSEVEDESDDGPVWHDFR